MLILVCYALFQMLGIEQRNKQKHLPSKVLHLSRRQTGDKTSKKIYSVLDSGELHGEVKQRRGKDQLQWEANGEHDMQIKMEGKQEDRQLRELHVLMRNIPEKGNIKCKRLQFDISNSFKEWNYKAKNIKRYSL